MAPPADTIATADFYRLVFESMREGVVVQDATGAIVACNPAATRILGLSEDQLAGRSSFDPRWRAIRQDGSPYPGEEHPGMLTLATGEPVRGAVMGIDAPGRGRCWVSINTQPLVRPGEDRPYAVIASFTDVTGLEQAAEKVRTGEKRLEMALEKARAGIWEWDVASGTIFWSETVAALFGMQPEDFDGAMDSYIALVHPDDRDKVLGGVDSALSDPSAGDAFQHEHRLLLADGSIRWIECVGQVERDAGGTPLTMRGTIADISARKDLEAQVLQRSKMESIGVLAGGVAHDFNNLLTAIMTATDMAARSPGVAGTAAAELLGIVQDATDRAGRLTRQLLTFARKQAVTERACAVDELVGGMCSLLQTLVGEAIQLDVSLDAASCQVRADPHQLEQLLVNLAVNAREAMPDGGRLSIATRGVSSDGDWIELAVADTGCGIEPGRLEHIFDPFYTTKETGSGLGLATSYGIVTQMGGTIRCTSEVGAGTAFRIRLPRVRSQRPATRPASPTTAAGNGETILLVDDNEPARRALTLGLRSLGYQVISASGADEALAAVEGAERLDLVVSDVVMPEVRGPELAGRIRALRPGIPVLYISGYTDSALDEAELGDGEALLRKPFSVEMLGDAMRRLLDRPTA